MEGKQQREREREQCGNSEVGRETLDEQSLESGWIETSIRFTSYTVQNLYYFNYCKVCGCYSLRFSREHKWHALNINW